MQENIYKNNSQVDGDFARFNIPLVFLNTRYFRLEGFGGSVPFVERNLYFDIGLKGKVNGYPYESDFIEEKTPNLFIGGFIRVLIFSFNYVSSVTHEDAGSLKEVSALYPFKLFDGNWYLVPKTGAMIQDETYSNFYFGVDSSEAVEFPEYNISGETQINYFSLINVFQITDSFQLRIMTSKRVANDTILNSPIVKQREQTQHNFMFLYGF